MTGTSNKRASIVIPFYRGRSILANTLSSIARQDFPHQLLEVIITHDGSSEDVTRFSREILEDIPLSQVWIPRRGYRLATARNAGIKCSSGGTIILIDFDIVVPDTFVSTHMSYQQSSSRRITFGLRRFVDLSHVEIELIRAGAIEFEALPEVASISNRLRTVDPRLQELALLPQHPFPCNLCHGCNLAFPRQLAIDVGLFDEAFNGHSNYEDIEFAHRMRTGGADIVFVPEATVYHQENDIVDYQTRRLGMSVNLCKLYDRVPGLQDFRQQSKEQSKWQTPQN
jgi:chondroitin synthase